MINKVLAIMLYISGRFDSKSIVKEVVWRKNNIRGGPLLIQGGDNKIYIYIYIYIYYVYTVYMCIYIYIERERERYIYIYIHTYIICI